ncbi:MAG: hypothetical protein ACFB4I_00050 [Cyanophyceae cyanobacterium]
MMSASQQSKQPYHSPQFSVYGSVAESTLALGDQGTPDGEVLRGIVVVKTG